MRLTAAAAVLRAGDAQQIFGARFPGEFVMTSVARLLEALAYKIHEHVDLGHQVVSAATEIAEHALAHVPTNGPQQGPLGPEPHDRTRPRRRPAAAGGHEDGTSG